jgi:hypothetical protein
LFCEKHAYQDYNDVLFILRMDARIGSAKDGFAEAYAFTGPPSGGKSFVVLRLLRLLGQNSHHHVQPLPAVYFTAPPRQDANASVPVTAELSGCRLCTPKEQPVKPIDPTALKAILDGRDVAVSARHNNSQKGDAISFDVTWAIIIQSQGAIKLHEDESDIGVLDKIIEFRPPFQFLAKEALDELNPRHREADARLLDMCNSGMLNGEMLFHMQVWYSLLDRSICKHRGIAPIPPKSLEYRKEANTAAGTDEDAFVLWMKQNLVYVDPSEASATKAINEALKCRFGNYDPSRRTAAGIGPRIYQYRPRGKPPINYYKVLIPGHGSVPRPVRLMTADEKASRTHD